MSILPSNEQPTQAPKTRAEYIALAQQRAEIALRSHDSGAESFHLTYAHLYATLALSAPEITTEHLADPVKEALLLCSVQFGDENVTLTMRKEVYYRALKSIDPKNWEGVEIPLSDANVGGELAIALADQATKTSDLLNALRRYGQHEKTCALIVFGDNIDSFGNQIITCTCGLNDAILAAQMPVDPNAP